MNFRLLSCLGMAGILSACSGGVGPSSSPAVVGSQSHVQKVTGTLKITANIGKFGTKAAKTSRRPEYVSPATGNAELFIDNAASPAGGGACTSSGTGGTGTGCTIAWSANLTVPASHTFAVEIDTGTKATPNNTMLAEGEGSYAIVSGNNTLSALTLNGDVSQASYTVTPVTMTTACFSSGTGSPTTTVDTCDGQVTLADAAGEAIVYGGATTVPTEGNSPTSGNVYDNDGGGSTDVTFASDTPSVGNIVGSGQSPYSTVTTNLLTINGVNTTGVYNYEVQCVSGANGTFSVPPSGGTGFSYDVGGGEISALSPAVSYPSVFPGTTTTAPSFSCASGAISAATGTLPVN